MLDEIVGREHELDGVARFVDGIAAGARALVLAGEAGAGKTTLLDLAIRQVRERGWPVLEARPAETEARLSFAALGDLLRGRTQEVLGGLPVPQRRALAVALVLEDPPERPPEPHVIAAALRSALLALAADTPILVAVDDVQWLDGPSADALGFAARRLDREPIGLVCTERTDRGGRPPLGLDRARLPVEIVPVGGLSIGALHRMLRNRLGVSLSYPTLRRIEAASGGNPFVALEIARALQRRGLPDLGAAPLPVPDTVAELVQERLAQVDAPTLESMRLVALMPEPRLERALAAGADEAALHAAAAAGFLETTGDRLRFSHPLLASVVAESIPPARRRALHTQLAESAADGEERVRHLALATPGPSATTATEVDAAARAAIARGAPATAAELFALAAALTPDELAPQRRARELEAADYLAIAGDTRSTRAFLERLVKETPPGPDRGEALLRLARIREDDFDAAEALVQQALREARDDARLRADLHIVVSDIATARGDGPRSREHAQLALDQAEISGDPALIASTLGQLVWLDWGAGRPLDVEGLDRALALERTVDPLLLRVSPSQVAGHALLGAGRLDEARTAFEGALAQAESAGVQYWRTDVIYRLCLLEGRAGNLARADELADEGLDAAEQLGLEQLVSAVLYGRGLTHLLLGRVDEARAAAERGLAASREVRERRYAVRNAWLLGLVDLATGRTAEAAQRLTAVLEPIEALSDPAFSRGMLPAIVEAQLAVGELEGARETLALLEQDLRDPVSAAQAARCRGAVAAAGSDLEGALAALQEAVRLHDEAPLPLERAQTLLVLGGVQRRLKQRGAARQTLSEALAIAERIGAPLWAARARAELGRVSGRAPGPRELTESERRVAELVAQGLTNKEVAGSLFVSVRAVESNLSKVYAKLGVRSRTELAGRLGKDA